MRSLGLLGRGAVVAALMTVALVLWVEPVFAAQAPTVESSWSSDVGYTTATLTARINPGEAETIYRFEYGPDTSYGTSAPVPDGQINPGSEAVRVVEHLTSIQSGATFHYRVVAVNAEGTTDGPDKTFTTFSGPVAQQPDTCPNAPFRTGPSAVLPDCRAYEMVSPVDKNGADVNAYTYKEFWASASGERIEFRTRTGMARTNGSGALGFTQWVAARDATGWTSQGITPTPAVNAPLQLFFGSTLALDFSEELERAVITGYDLPHVDGAVPKKQNLYLEDTSTGKVLESTNRFEGLIEPADPREVSHPVGVSADLGVVTFETPDNLVEPASGSVSKLYALDHGKVHLTGILPDGSMPPGGSTGVRDWRQTLRYRDTVSDDGSRVLFKAEPAGFSEPQLYMRKNQTSTTWISEPEGTVSVSEPHNVHFQMATPDGTKVAFSTADQLSDSDPGGPGVALYLYSDGPDPSHETNLTFVARFSGFQEGASEGDVVKGISDDGTHIYFASEYNPSALPFDTVGTGFFLWDRGQVRQIAPTPDAVDTTTVETSHVEEAEVSADGQRLVFMNTRQITKADIEATAGGNTELYLYDEKTDSLKCISCSQNGAAVTSGVERVVEATSPLIFSVPIENQPHFFSRNGKYAFFNTREGLLPQDTNRLPDAYEYNVETGELSLLSTGTGDEPAWFVDASADGRNAFLVTHQALVSRDPDKLVDIYVARIGGGFVEPSLTHPCAGDACQGIPGSPLSFNTASGFTGNGNPSWASTIKVTKRKGLTPVQKLRQALRVCKHKRKKRQRTVCEVHARNRFVTQKSAVHSSRRVGR